jgi:AcrR family transcriptional regulator
VRTAVLNAVVEELVESGYAATTFERVATRAGVHRATLYRRWGSKEELVADALAAQAARDVPMPDTGSLREDLRLLMHAITANISSQPGEGLLRTLVSDASRVPGIATAGRRFWEQRFALAQAVFDRAVARGELPAGTDTRFLVELLVAPLFLRQLVTGQPLTDAYADAVAQAMLAPGPP